MIIKVPSKNVIASGVVPNDAKFSIVGEKNSSLCKWGIKVDETGTGDARTATWANCIAWNRLADIAKDIQKGDVVLVAGKEVERSYTNDDGETKLSTEIVVDFLSITKSVQREEQKATTKATSKLDVQEIDDNSELPF